MQHAETMRIEVGTGEYWNICYPPSIVAQQSRKQKAGQALVFGQLAMLPSIKIHKFCDPFSLHESDIR
jgi:hypothetical protein